MVEICVKGGGVMLVLEDLLKWCNENQMEVNGKWVPARPINYRYRSFRKKLKEAYLVYKGEAECVLWKDHHER